MGLYRRICLLFSCFLMICFCLSGCSDFFKKEKKGKVVVTSYEYSVRQTHGTGGEHGNSFVIDARGKVKNVGDVDVKNVVVTGYCRSCTLAFTSQQWFTSDCEKTATQKAIINYLPAGAEAEFSFAEIAFYFTYESAPPEELPEKMEVVVDSFETVQ